MRGRSFVIRNLLGALCLAHGLSSAPAHAQSDTADSSESASQKRVAVGKLKGPKPDDARKRLVEGLEESGAVRLVGDDDPLESGASEEDIAAYAKRVGADAVLLGTTSQKGATWTANITVHNGEDGSEVETVEVKGRLAQYRNGLSDASLFQDAIGRTRLEPELVATSGASDGEETVEEELEASVDGQKVLDLSSGGRPSPLEVRGGMRLYSRSFRYTDPANEVNPLGGYPDLATYNVAAAPMVFANGTWYPGAHFTDGWLAHLGVTGGFEVGFATHVEYAGKTLDQSHSLWFVGPKFRIPLGVHDVGIFGTYGTHNFEVSGDTNTFPDVRYEFVDIGLDTHLRFDQLRIGAHAQYRMVLDSGPIGDANWYPNTTARGVTFGGEVGWQFLAPFEFLVGLDSLQYGLDFNPISLENPRAAGGATDRYLSVWAALSYVLPGDEAKPAAKSDGSPTEEPSGSSFDSFDEDF